MVSSQYPHQLVYDAAGAVAAQRDPEGHWLQPGVVAEVQTISCRVEASDSAGHTVASEDGQQSAFAFVVYLPVGAPVIPLGKMVEFRQGDLPIGGGPVKRIHRGFFNVRLWV